MKQGQIYISLSKMPKEETPHTRTLFTISQDTPAIPN